MHNMHACAPKGSVYSYIQNCTAHFQTLSGYAADNPGMILRREKKNCKFFREVFQSFCKVFQSFRKFFEGFRELFEAFGSIRTHWDALDAFGSNCKRLDVFKNFEIFWIFEWFLNVFFWNGFQWGLKVPIGFGMDSQLVLEWFSMGFEIAPSDSGLVPKSSL